MSERQTCSPEAGKTPKWPIFTCPVCTFKQMKGELPKRSASNPDYVQCPWCNRWVEAEVRAEAALRKAGARE